MSQCFHLGTGGRRCRRDAEEGAAFCSWHRAEDSAEALREGWSLRRLVFRLAALVLLALFLIPLVIETYRILRDLLN